MVETDSERKEGSSGEGINERRVSGGELVVERYYGEVMVVER